MDETSIPGTSSDPLEPDFEKSLGDEGFELVGREKPAEEKPVEKTPEKEQEVELEKPEEKGDKKPDEGKKDDKKVEGKEDWRDMIAKRRQDKARAEAKEEIPEPEKPIPSKSDEVVTEKPVISEKRKALAEKYGIEPEDLNELFPVVTQEKIIKEGMSEEDRKILHEYKSERDGLLIEKGYKADFDTNVLPLLKEEYPNISDAKVKEVQEQILEKLKTDEFARTPLDVLYRGDKSFRGLVSKPKNGPDEGSRIPAEGNSNKVYDFDNVTDADLKNSDFPFEKYSSYMEKKERAK